MNELTPPQRKIFDFISQQVEEVGVPPTVREIARRFDVAIGTVQGHLKALDRKGVVRRMRDRARGLALAVKRDWTGSLRLPVLGR
ncbi:MAG TPA: MarR family transcriptional regulator, partial [Elusimicrobiota bacterium]|nr:MarR family transcriptional regulator [Elusimicrobiota bacterium]